MLHDLLDGALQLRVLAPDYVVGAVVNFDVGSDATILHHPLAVQVVPGEFGASDVATIDERNVPADAADSSPSAFADERAEFVDFEKLAEDIAIGGSAAFPRASFPSLELVWATSDEFGPFTSLRLFVGTDSGEASAIEIPLPSGKSLRSGGLVPVDLGPYLTKLGRGWGYVRLEARTENAAGEEFRCYTNPIWVRVTAL